MINFLFRKNSNASVICLQALYASDFHRALMGVAGIASFMEEDRRQYLYDQTNSDCFSMTNALMSMLDCNKWDVIQSVEDFIQSAHTLFREPQFDRALEIIARHIMRTEKIVFFARQRLLWNLRKHGVDSVALAEMREQFLAIELPKVTKHMCS